MKYHITSIGFTRFYQFFSENHYFSNFSNFGFGRSQIECKSKLKFVQVYIESTTVLSDYEIGQPIYINMLLI